MTTASKYFFRVIIPQQILAIIAIMYLIISGNSIWLLASFIAWFLMYVMGEGIFLHRYFAHKSYECNIWLARVFSFFAMLGGFGSPISFRAIHMAHHSQTDQAGDPHTPAKGAWHAYMGWYYRPLPQGFNVLMASRHLIKDRYYVFLEEHKVKLWWIVLLILSCINWKLGVFTLGLGGAIGLNFSSITNSVLHRWGSRRFVTNDTSTNLWWLSWITWHGSSSLHNNHHGMPGRYHDSHAWYELDVGKWIIPLFATKINQNNR